jgi:hypothetical protein
LSRAHSDTARQSGPSGLPEISRLMASSMKAVLELESHPHSAPALQNAN